MHTALPICALALVFGYLCGSIPFGVLLTRLTGGPDLRSIGSGNIGATNVLRTGRKGLAAATLVGDMLKGTVAVLLTRYVLGDHYAIAGRGRRLSGPRVSGVAALSRRQGRGDLYRRAFGRRLAGCSRVLRGLARNRGRDPLLVARRAGREPRRTAFLWAWGDVADAQAFALLSALLWIMHRGNIGRLMSGSEGRIGGRTSTAPKTDSKTD